MKKVIFIGIDGMDPNITETMMDRGELPHFSRLREHGFYSRLATINPPQSPVVWASIATGVNPGEHGVFDFIHRNPKNYLPYLSLLQMNGFRYVNPVKAKPFWEKAAEKGINSVVLKWPVTFPASSTRGTVLAGLGVPDIKGSLGLYTLFTTGRQKTNDTKGRFVTVTRNGSRISTTVPGPFVGSLTGKKESAIPLTIEINSGSASCTVCKTEFNIRPGQWSEWVKLTFDVGMFRTTDALCRFYLKSITPEFELYMTPLNVSYDSSEFSISSPKEYAGKLSEAIGPYTTLGMAEDTNAMNDGVLNEDEFLAQCDSIMAERERMFLHEFDRFQEGILACVFDTTDRVQHMFWRMIDTTHACYDEQLAKRYRNVIGDYYSRMDRTLGAILDNSSPDTRLLICSDHGFTSFKKSVHLNTWLAQNGFLKFKKGYDSSEGLFEGVDWGNTKAYAVGLTSIYLNRKGREENGIVTQEQAPEVFRDLGVKLRAFNVEGDAVVKELYDTRVIFSGKETANAPDAVIAYDKEYRGSWQTAVGGAPCGPITEINSKKWSGDHCCAASAVPGIFFSYRKEITHNLSIFNIASFF